jgi:serine/threonine protein kinase
MLPADKTANTERRQRFIQESRAAPALNHPNIITIYDIVQHDGADLIVMEFVPGKTLDQIIPKRGVPPGVPSGPG